MKRVPWSVERILLLSPAILLLLVVVVIPAARVMMLSIAETDPARGPEATAHGFGQFLRLWQDGRWWVSLRNTAVFTFGSVAIEMVLGTIFAFLLHRSFRGRGVARALTMLPWALPTAVMALAWAWIFNDTFGVANDLLRRSGLAARPIAWLGEPGLAMLAMIVADVWKTTPFVMLIVLAGLQGIPPQVLEAARVDGLGRWRRIRHVSLPLLAPSLLLAFAFRSIQAFGAFDLVYVMTGGGPGGSTETVSLYAFQNFFRYLDFSYGAAIATQAVALLAVVSLLGLKVAGARRSLR